MLFLSNDLHEKGILKSQDKSWRYCGVARAIYNLPSCYNIAFVLHKKVHLFSADYKRVISSCILLWW